MKKCALTIVATLLTLGYLSVSCSRGGDVRQPGGNDTIAYIIGMNVGRNLIKMDSTLNYDAVCEGIKDVFKAATRFSDEEAKALYLRHVNFLLPERIKAYEEQFLQDYVKSNRSYARTPTGVTYTVEDVGDQNLLPSLDADTVSIRYILRDIDGKLIYSSYEKEDTLRTGLGSLKKGLRESLRLIGKGGRITTWLPAATAYGAEGDKELGIAPNATLQYEVELLDVEKFSTRRRK